MSRGEIWTVAGESDYAGKPRPALVLQDDVFEGLGAVTICPFTSNSTEAVFRIAVEPTAENGLTTTSFLMVDKVTTVRRERLGRLVGVVDTATLSDVRDALFVFLGFARDGAHP